MTPEEIHEFCDGKLEIDVLIRGIDRFEEKHGEKAYEKFVNKLNKTLGKILPDFVSLWSIGSEERYNDSFLRLNKVKEQTECSAIKKAVSDILKEPEFQTMIDSTIKFAINDETAKLMRELYDTDTEFKERIDRYLKLPAAASSA